MPSQHGMVRKLRQSLLQHSLLPRTSTCHRQPHAESSVSHRECAKLTTSTETHLYPVDPSQPEEHRSDQLSFQLYTMRWAAMQGVLADMVSSNKLQQRWQHIFPASFLALLLYAVLKVGGVAGFWQVDALKAPAVPAAPHCRGFTACVMSSLHMATWLVICR